MPTPGARGAEGGPGADHCCPPRTKIFIRFPKTLFATEDALEVRRQSLGEREAPPFLCQWVHSGEQEINHCTPAPFPGSPPRPHSAALLTSSNPSTRHLSCPWVQTLSMSPHSFGPSYLLSFTVPSYFILSLNSSFNNSLIPAAPAALTARLPASSPELWPIDSLSQPQPRRSRLPGGAFTGGRNSSG